MILLLYNVHMEKTTDSDENKSGSNIGGYAMKLTITKEKKHAIAEGMFGLFFEDINYAADGGLYAEMIENRSFEFMDCYGDVGDYYVKADPGYAWKATKDKGAGKMEYVEGSPVSNVNPHYLRFTATKAGQGFANKAYRGIYMTAFQEYKVSFYARTAKYLEGNLKVQIRAGGKILIENGVKCIHVSKGEWQKWNRYELTISSTKDVEAGEFVILLDSPGTVEFDHISMMPADAVAGVFRKDLFDALKGMHPGFLRFPGGCIIEGNTLENRYQWKNSVGDPIHRKWNFNRWAVHGTNEKNGWNTEFSHYNQSLGLGYYEYFLLCEMIGAKALPVLNVGLACQYQSYELVEVNDEAFMEYVQDALDLIEFANGPIDSKWGSLRAKMGHPESFELDMLGIGNEQWQTKHVDFYTRYQKFEQAIHAVYPAIKLIGSAGPTVETDTYQDAWDFYHKEAADKPDFTYAVDEHYYMKPEWFLEQNEFYDNYPRDVKVFSGEYAAHEPQERLKKHKNTLNAALAEAAFLTGVERNADVVVLASYAPLFARLGYVQWSPDMIWFDEKKVYLSPSYYVQKLYCENAGTVTLELHDQEKALREKDVYVNASYDEKSGEYILKIVNNAAKSHSLVLTLPEDVTNAGNARLLQLVAGGKPGSKLPQESVLQELSMDITSKWKVPAKSFTVVRFC